MDDYSSDSPFLYPKPLSIVKLIAPIKYKRDIAIAVESFGQLEPIMVDPRTGADQVHVENRRNNLESFRSKYSSIISSIDESLVIEKDPIQIDQLEQKIMDLINSIYDNEGKQFEKIISRKDEIKTRSADLENIANIFQELEYIGINNQVDILKDTTHTKTFLGKIYPPQLNRMLWLINEVTEGRHFIYEKEISDKETIVLVSVLQEDNEIVDAKLKSINFQYISIPKELNIDKYSKELCIDELDQLENEFSKLQSELEDLTNSSGFRIAAGLELINIELQRISIELTMRRTENTCVLWAWIPHEIKAEFKTAIHKATDGSALIDFKKGDFDPETTPSYSQNSEFMQPMRNLVNAYGVPSTDGVDPYPFVVILYPILFAIMFADVGHGFLLTLVGLYAWRKKKKMKEIPKGISGYFYGGAELLIIMGITSFFVGFAMNSLFGDETILWKVGFLRSLFENTTWGFFFKTEKIVGENGEIELLIERNYVNFLVFSFAVGAFVIILGILINIYQLNIHRHSNSELYATLTLLGVYIFSIFTALFAVIGIKSLMIISLILIPTMIIATLEIERRAHGIDGMLIGVDHLISLLSNTFSFGRLLAMNTIHFVLAFLPYLFLDKGYHGILSEDINNIIWLESTNLLIIKIIGAIIGAIIILPVETTFSSLQSLRLNWVEFFGKFYKAQGIPFKPIKVKRYYTSEIK